ncbi:hypothetical protein [Herbidospora sp. NBRC 101105]|uniref:hypothetical protein n=1 Tax=Herbidospora sp. NBRC 101105 TaxID=3032195 RepID=UPI0024A367C6|nr:hypothetical protein [Herbidospora sp. NBRC 101105]GLX94965.1 hypothetical protein Hesp01_29150 [Herbidospora sp. NBRC 101105]
MLRLGEPVDGFHLLRVMGSPGGIVHVRDGLVVAATTPASPGPESLLIRSGRVSEAAWNEAFTAGAPDDRLAAELVGRGSVGEAGLEAVCLSAVFDAVFAMAMFGVEDTQLEPVGDHDVPPPLPVVPGIARERLARETARRLAITEEWRELGITPFIRPTAVQPIRPPTIAADRLRHEILIKANGRRTPRDIAFALGQGLFVVLKEIAALVGEGLLTTTRSST